MDRTQLEIRLLGPLQVLRGSQVLELPRSRKARALLAYLVATAGQHSRGALCTLLWQDVSDPRAGLRWGLSKVRAVLEADGGERIRATRDVVGFVDRGVDVDLNRARSLLAADPAAPSIEALTATTGAFEGEFLDGLQLPGNHQWETWCLGMRETTRRLHIGLRDRLVERLREKDAEAALPHALARIAVDPLSEQGYMVAMELLAAMGRAERARELYDRCRQLRLEHLGEHASPDLVAALRRLAPSPPSLFAPPRPPARDAGGETAAELLAALPAPPHLPSVSGQEPALVGRRREVALLQDLLRETGSEGAAAAVLITGEPGIGKTRLLRELAHSVRDAGGWVLSGQVVETEEVRPYGPWTDIVRQVPGVVLDEGLRRDLAGFLPSPVAREDGPAERAQLFGGVARLLQRLAEDRSPGLVVLDDLQWLDASSAALLHYVVRTRDPCPLLFACAARDREGGPTGSLPGLVRSLVSAGRLATVHAERLSYEDTAALVDSVDHEADAAPIFRSSEGNPLFALELVRARRDGTPGTSATIEQELDGRLSRLDEEALDLLAWAAALGRAFSVPVLTRVLDWSEPRIVSALVRLEDRGILRAAGADGYDFTHSQLRRAAYRRLAVPARRSVHRRIARVLDDSGAGPRRVPGAVAHHAELGGLQDLAARACLEAAEESVWLFAFDEAAELVERGLGQASQLPDDDRIPLELDLLRVYARPGMRPHRPPDLGDRVRQVMEEARAGGMPTVVANAHFQLAALQYDRDAFEETRHHSIRSAEAGQRTEPHTAARVLAEAATCLLLIDRDLDHARRLALEAHGLAHADGVELTEVALARALLDHHDGRLHQAADGYDAVVRLGRRVKDHWWECFALTRKILADLQRGITAEALDRAEEAESLALRVGDQAEAAFARGLAGVAIAMSGNEEAEQARGLGLADDALSDIRTLDSLWRLAQVQAYAADVELERGRPDAARERAHEVLHAGETLSRPSLLALARAHLARSAAQSTGLPEARDQLDAAERLLQTHPVSSQARRAVERARTAVLKRRGERVERHA